MRLKDRDFDLFIAEKSILKQIEKIAKQINKDYEGKQPILVAVLNGSFMFAADLAKNITIPAEITFIKVKSYQQFQSTGKHREFIGLDTPLRDRHVIVLEDIVDTGGTMQLLLGQFAEQEPLSVAIASLLFKPEALMHPISVKYVGFEIPNDFVVGYGLDYDGLGRNLRAIYKVASS